METIGERLKYLRKSRALTMRDLMNEFDLNSTSVISTWENDKFKPKQDTLLKYADYFNVSVDWILHGDMDSYIRDVLYENSLGLKMPDEAVFIQELSERFSKHYPSEREIIHAYYVFKEHISITFSLEQLIKLITDVDSDLIYKLNVYLDEEVFPLAMFSGGPLEQEKAKQPYIDALLDLLEEMRQTKHDAKKLLYDLNLEKDKMKEYNRIIKSKNQE